MKVLINDEIPVLEWGRFLDGNRHATPFQSHSYYLFFNSVSNFKARAFAVYAGDSIKALAVVTIQKERSLAGYFSRRAIIYGGPLVDDDYPEAMDLLMKHISQYSAGEAIYTEIRNLSDFSSLTKVFSGNGFRYIPYLNFRADTRDKNLMIKRVSESRLRQVKKAFRRGVECREAENEEDVMQFYLILRKLYKNKLNKPLPRHSFFLNFYNQNLGRFFLVWAEGKVIGGIMCPVLEGKALYEFYVCGMDEEYRDFYPSIVATWSAMEYANKSGIPLFDFMGAGKPGEEYGVRDFKARFGGEMVEYGRFLRVNRPFLYKIGKSGLNLMKFFSR